MRLAKAHCRLGRKYSQFHCSLMADLEQIHTLHLLYSTQNAKQVLLNAGYNSNLIQDAIEHITIDVQRYCVRLHVPPIKIKDWWFPKFPFFARTIVKKGAG